jgi:hypothetical protein
MVVVHRPGTKHGNADGLSRIPDSTPFCDAIELVALQKIYLVVDVSFAGEPMNSGIDSKRMSMT